MNFGDYSSDGKNANYAVHGKIKIQDTVFKCSKGFFEMIHTMMGYGGRR